MTEVKRLYKDWAKDYDSDSICNTAIILGEKMILPMLKPKKAEKILDIGCGTGRVTKLLAPKTKQVIGIDFSEEMLKVAKEKCKNHENVKFRKVNVSNKLPFKDNSFDKVTAILVLNHIKNSEKLFKEIFRVLKKGGVLLIDDFTTKFKKPFKPRHSNLLVKRADKKEELIFGKSMTEVINIIHATGFDIKDIKFTRIDKTIEPHLTKLSYKRNKGRTMEAFLLCKKP